MQINLKNSLPLIVVICFAVFAALPLFQSGFIPTHDGEYHFIRFFEFEKMLKEGHWFPRWASGLNSGYGVPLFNFHYPLPNYFGAFFHSLGFSLTDSFKMTLAAGYLLATIFCFLWLSRKTPHWLAAAATIVFAFMPYWFIDIYVRGAVGEVLALAWFMLALTSIERGWPHILIIAVAAIIVSHNILTIICLPVILGYLVLVKPKYWWCLLVSLGLSAYFWLPALTEQKYVVGLNTVDYRDHFPMLAQLLIPSWGTGFSGSGYLGNEMSFQIGIVALFTLFFGIILALREENQRDKLLVLYFLLIAAGSIFFMLTYSLSIWKLIPILAFIQYPWRFLSVLLPVIAFLTAYILKKFNKAWITLAFVTLAVFLSYSYSRPVTYLPRFDEYYLTRTNFTDGTSSLGNAFSTRWTGWKSVRPEKKIEFLSGSGEFLLQSERPLRYELVVNAKDKSTIRVNTLYYPGWTVTIDGVIQPILYSRDGTITFVSPSGSHRVSIFFTETTLRLFADLLSLASLFWFGGWIILKRYLV